MGSHAGMTESLPPTSDVLATLASRAAIALERATFESNAQTTDVQELVKALRAFLAEPGTGAPELRKSLLQTAADVLDRALILSGAPPVSSLSELANKVRGVADELAVASADLPPTELRRLRDVCLALSRAAQEQLPLNLHTLPDPAS